MSDQPQKTISRQDLLLMQKEYDLLKQKEKLEEGLPHIYSFPWYPWARAFYESTNKENFLTASNQCSKSSTQIRKTIHWATSPKMWPELWPMLQKGQAPNQFWYFYPTQEVATIEFETKWEPLFLPRGEYKTHPIYGWKEEYDKGMIRNIRFNSGITVYFKTYSQKVKDLQSGSVFSIFCFPAMTKIKTPFGDRNIENLRAGDLVISHSGINKIKGLGHREAYIYEIKFKNTTVRTTEEHPFFTKRGWVNAKDLINGDICFKFPRCLEKTIQLIWSFLKESNTRDSQIALTTETEIIGREVENHFMSNYGKNSIKNQLGSILLSTIRTSILSTIKLKIWFECLAENIQEFIKNKNGNLKNNIQGDAGFVRKNILQDRQKKFLLAFVQKSALLCTIASRLYVKNAGLRNLFAKIVSKDIVLNIALTNEKTNVYSISVENDNTYFSDNFLVHNCDEELPIELFPELGARLNATDGYFHMVFTATLGQLYWEQTIEPKSKLDEKHPNALKLQVSLYDCLEYEDGTKSHWTPEKIARAKAKCPTEAEVQRRIYGRFVKSEGLRYESFDLERNLTDAHPLPKSWQIYSGVDIGSGGSSGHPAAIIFVACSPDHKMGRVFKGWRGDGIPTSASDILSQYKKLKKGLVISAQYYDWAAKDFYTIASNNGEPFSRAEKGKDLGEGLLNTLFKLGMLKIQRGDVELEKLVSELRTLSVDKDKSKAKDDLIDALRYASTSIPWDFSDIEVQGDDEVKPDPVKKEKTGPEQRREWFMSKVEKSDEVTEELDFYNDLLGDYSSDDDFGY